MSAADVPALSDERDLWLRRLLEAERAAYLLGYTDGCADQARESDRVWAATPPPKAAIAPSHAELELLRYGPGGREHFGDPRPSDRIIRARRKGAA